MSRRLGRSVTSAAVAEQDPRPGRVLIGLMLSLVAALATSRVDARADAPASGSRCDGAGVRISRSFLGHPCRDGECATHKAGFAWADRNGINDPAECASAEDPAFAEGCRVFATGDLTAEQAGFHWARENLLDDRCHCGGAGSRFEGGCEAFVTIVH